MNVEDKVLIWRFNRGDCEAVRKIYEKHKCELLALAVSLLKNTAAAEDIVHDVFLAFLRLPHFRLTGSLKGYLATCVANGARNLIRANGRRQQEPIEEAMPIASSDPWPDGEAIFSEDCRSHSCAIGALPYEQREVVLLHHHGGLKFIEIAQSQNVSINTVLGRYRYGLEKLKTSMNPGVSHATERAH